MSTRRLIQFGKNSYVLSIPKSWVERNKLLKGSEISVEASAGSLLLAPTQNDGTAEVKVKKISCDDQVSVGRNIIAAYINNYTLIEVHGSKLKDHIKDIEDITHSLVALEIMEQTSKKVIIKDFLNTQDISMETIIKRIDIIIRAMFTEIHEVFEKGEKISLDKMDTDVNRLFYVGQKLLNKLLDRPNMSKSLNMDIKDTLFYWNIIDCLEKIADQQKRFIRNIENLDRRSVTMQPLRENFEELVKRYMTVIKAYYKLDKAEADSILFTTKDMFEKSERIVDKYVYICEKPNDIHNTTEAIEKLKKFENYINLLAKAIIYKE